VRFWSSGAQLESQFLVLLEWFIVTLDDSEADGRAVALCHSVELLKKKNWHSSAFHPLSDEDCR
jgi:hypothetical protein